MSSTPPRQSANQHQRPSSSRNNYSSRQQQGRHSSTTREPADDDLVFEVLHPGVETQGSKCLRYLERHIWREDKWQEFKRMNIEEQMRRYIKSV